MSLISTTMVPHALLALISALALAQPVAAALPQVDFDRMGKVGLAGSFAGLDVFDSNVPALDPTAATILSHSSDDMLSRLAATNTGGAVSASCSLGDNVYFAGNFSSLQGVAANNIASYTPSSSSFSALGSNGPNGPISSLYCDTKDNKVWAGGKFTSPAESVAVWDPSAKSWSGPPFGGLAGAQAEVLSITTNSTGSSLFFAGSFITMFASNGSTTVNNTNNPGVPASSGASPFSSSLVPIPLGEASIDGNPSSSDPQFGNIDKILCPGGGDGPGNTWFAGDGNTAVITARAFRFLSASGIRLGNTFLDGRGTTEFQVTSIPDNTIQALTYVDPTTGKNATCTDKCPLLTDSSIPYQDFLFSNAKSITGVQIKLSGWKGAGPGLHLFQLLSSGAFASAVEAQNGQSCFAPAASNTTRTGDWNEVQADAGIAGTVVNILSAPVKVGTNPNQGPSFTWMPYVSASGTYDVFMLVPGCSKLNDCGRRTSVRTTVFPGPGLDPTVQDVDQTNQQDATVLLYSGPIVPTNPDFVMTITQVLSNNPKGNGQNGEFQLVADRVQLVLRQATGGNTTTTTGGGSSSNVQTGFGFFEWPLGTSGVDATERLANTTETALDHIAISMFNAVGGNSSLRATTSPVITSVAHHSSGTVFLGGNFSLTTGSATGSNNVVAFTNGQLKALPDNGVNGAVTSLVLNGDDLFVGGAFTSTSAGQTKSQGVLRYNVGQNSWSAVGGGVDGAVASLSFSDSQLHLAGNFTHLLPSTTAGGFAVWNTNNGTWATQSSLLSGSLTLASNTTSVKGLDKVQFVAGRISAFSKFGSTGFVTLSNGGEDGVPKITPLGVQLDQAGSTSSSSASRRRRSQTTHALRSWLPKIEFTGLFARAVIAERDLSPTQLPNATTTTGPSVYAGAFWKNNTGSTEVTIIGGNFSLPASTGGSARNVAVYDPKTGMVIPLKGAQVDGAVRALLVQGDVLYVGGAFTLEGGANGFAAYDLAKQEWMSTGDAMKPSTGGELSVLSLTSSAAKANTVVVAGAFGGAGALTCNAICAFDTSSKQWSAFGTGVGGQIATVTYAGGNQDILVAAGAIALSDNSPAHVAKFAFENSTWAAVGSGLPGPVTALEVNNGNASSIFAAGKSLDSNATFLQVWNGASWSSIGSSLDSTSNVTSLTMVPLVSTHASNGIIEDNRMLLVSGALFISSSGGKRDGPSSASSALFDGQNFTPYLVSQGSGGGSGSVSGLIHSFSTINFNHRHVLATGIVILISIAIAAGIVFLMVLVGIIWALLSRRHEREEGKYDVSDADDDSTRGRPTSLLAHINAATRNTIVGNGAQSPFGHINNEKELAGAAGVGGAYSQDHSHTHHDVDHDDGYGPDSDGFARAETPSDAMGMAVGGDEDGRPARARYSFDGAEDGELPMTSGAEVLILDDRDPAWWYAVDPRTGREGVVPSNYVMSS